MWLNGLHSYFYFYRIVGTDLDSQHILLSGTQLTGIAVTWFTQDITGPSHARKKWNFEGLITALFHHFLTEITAQKAVDAYYMVKYSKTKGALGFWNDLVQASERMLHPSDQGTMKRQFLNGLPSEVVELTLKSQPLNVEMVSVEEIIDAICQMEATLHYIHHRKKQDGVAGPPSSNSGIKIAAERPRLLPSQRFVGL
jgi:hypothetical protein